MFDLFSFKQDENVNQEFILPDNQSRVLLSLFYLALIASGFLFYNFVILTEIERVKLLDFGLRYEIAGMWISFILAFFIIPSSIMVIFGIRIIREKRYPSFGARVAVKTRIIRGQKAVKLGRRYLTFGSIAIFLIIASIFNTRRIHRSFMENPLKWASQKSWDDAGLQRPNF